MQRSTVDPCILIKTPLNLEKIAATLVTEKIPWLKTVPEPGGYKGLVLVYGCREREKEASIILSEIPEADRIILIEGVAKADPQKIAETASILSRNKIDRKECFAVRTVRRGKHNFTSIDVNIIVGDAVRRETGACVNLSNPDKIVLVEIIRDKAYISIVPGNFMLRKLPPGKKPVHRILRKIRVVQMPYLGPLDACKNMGIRVGREIQNFEVGELVIAPIGKVPADELGTFLRGLREGIESRYRIQKKSYNNRKPWKVPVYVQDLYEFVRAHSNEPIIVLEPEGKPVSEAGQELRKIFAKPGKINILAGSREGIPLGVYRFADLVIDIAPGITLSTEYAVSSALIAIVTMLYDEIDDDDGVMD